MLGGIMTIRNKQVQVGQGFSLLSDLHLGSAHTDEEMIKRDLEVALKKKDRIAINGDVFDLILPTDSKRFTPHVVHPRFQGCTDLLNKVCDWGVDFFSPYAHLIDWINSGNHCSAIEKHNSFDPIHYIVQRLNERLTKRRSKHQIKYGGYCGFAVYTLPHSKSFTLFYHHGFGGGSTLSGAASDLNKMLAQLEGVDLVWLGHKHQKLSGHVVRISPARSGDQPQTREVRFVRTGAYLDSTRGQSQDSVKERGRQSIYSVDKGYPFAGLGGARVVVDSVNPLSLKVIQ